MTPPLGWDPTTRTAYRTAPAGSLLDRAGFNQPTSTSGHHIVDLLMGAAGHKEVATDAREVLGELLLKAAYAVDILRTVADDGVARRAALIALTGKSS